MKKIFFKQKKNLNFEKQMKREQTNKDLLVQKSKKKKKKFMAESVLCVCVCEDDNYIIMDKLIKEM